MDKGIADGEGLFHPLSTVGANLVRAIVCDTRDTEWWDPAADSRIVSRPNIELVEREPRGALNFIKETIRDVCAYVADHRDTENIVKRIVQLERLFSNRSPRLFVRLHSIRAFLSIDE